MSILCHIYHSSAGSHLGCFSLELLCILLLCKFLFICLVYLRVELCTIHICFTLVDTSQEFCRVTVSIYRLPAVQEGSMCSVSSPLLTVGSINLVLVSHSPVGMWEHLIIAQICIS